MISSKLFFGGLILLVGVSMKGTFSSGSSSPGGEEKKGGLEEFRDMVAKLHFPKEYMKEDGYLLRHLSAKDFNLGEAFDNLQRVLALREAEKVDSILEEDWSDLDERFPFSVSGVSKEGRPILYFPFGKWDFSKEMASGDFERVTRFLGIKMKEEAGRKARSMIKETKNSTNDLTTFDIIYNLDGYTLGTHGCLQCIQMYRNSVQKSDSLYKEALNKYYIINAPAVFEAIYPWIASVAMEDKSRESVTVLGGRSSFEPVLLQHIDLDQFPKEILV